MSLVPYLLFTELCPRTEQTITLPIGVFRHLLTLVATQQLLDEDRYLERNPDVASALRRGNFESPHLHYANFGYFENRAGAGFEVDESYYRSVNPDVERAIATGHWPSASAHYEAIGMFEWRSPNANAAPIVETWRSLFLAATATSEETASSAQSTNTYAASPTAAAA